MTQHVSIADFTRLDTHRPAHAVRRTGVREARAQVAPSHTGNWRHWHMEVDAEDIVWLGLDVADASTNLLSAQVLEELDAVLEALSHASPSGVVISSRKANGFIAGADVHEFTHLREIDDALPLIQRGQQVFNRLADLECPTVAMIHGFCLGGGLELALACRYRVAADDADGRLGLPEVKLGIHPGFGGSVRATALLGAPAAMELMLTGRTVSPGAARKLGLVDAAVPRRHLKRAARAILRAGVAPHRPGRLARLGNHCPFRPLIGQVMRRKLEQRARPDHYPALYALLELWERHGGDPGVMLAEEARSVARLITGATAQNLVRLFLLRERLKGYAKPPSGNKFHPQHVHVIGGGVMGGDIAAWCAMQGLQVTVQDSRIETLGRVVRRARDLYLRKLKRPHAVRAAMDRLLPDPEGYGITKADVVIEAIYEDATAKQELFRQVEPRLKGGALLATNTSSIPLAVLGEALADPSRLVGLHFFNPVAKMPLVEVVAGGETAGEAVRRATVFAGRIDRLPLPVRSTPGFLVNRILMPYLLEAVELESEGVPAAQIDAAAVAFGMPMGPVELADSVGLDICLSVTEILAGELAVVVPQRLKQLVAMGHLGVKTGAGFYDYKRGKPVISRQEADIAQRTLTDRLMLRMVNEAMACLREGVVADADLLDAGMVFGTGFAPFRGGPMHYSGVIGTPNIVEKLHVLAERFGKRFTPDPGWQD